MPTAGVAAPSVEAPSYPAVGGTAERLPTMQELLGASLKDAKALTGVFSPNRTAGVAAPSSQAPVDQTHSDTPTAERLQTMQELLDSTQKDAVALTGWFSPKGVAAGAVPTAGAAASSTQALVDQTHGETTTAERLQTMQELLDATQKDAKTLTGWFSPKGVAAGAMPTAGVAASSTQAPSTQAPGDQRQESESIAREIAEIEKSMSAKIRAVEQAEQAFAASKDARLATMARLVRLQQRQRKIEESSWQ